MGRKATSEPHLTRIATLLSGHGLMALATLARNLVLARLLGPQDYGLAVALVVITSAAEMVTTLGLPQLMVRHKRGAGAGFQATLHAMQLGRGLAGAAVVILSAGPLADALDAPEATQTLRFAALVPLVLAFTHLDQFRAQRHRRHLPQALILAVPAFIAAVAIWPIYVGQTGPQIMLSLLLIQACASVAMSHLVARRAYRLRFQWDQIGPVLRQGVPLASNGVLMFVVLHAEKLIAGAGLGLVKMGLLAMGFTLTLTPALIMAHSFQAFHLPRLRTEGPAVLGVAMLLGASLATGLTIIVPLGLPHLGSGFEGLNGFVPLLGCLAALRLPKSALATAALAEGRTHLPVFANLPRLLATPVIWLALSWGEGIGTLLIIATAAEILGVGLGIWLARATTIPVRDLAIAALVFVLVLSGQPALAALICAAGWALYAVHRAPEFKRGAA